MGVCVCSSDLTLNESREEILVAVTSVTDILSPRAQGLGNISATKLRRMSMIKEISETSLKRFEFSNTKDYEHFEEEDYESTQSENDLFMRRFSEDWSIIENEEPFPKSR